MQLKAAPTISHLRNTDEKTARLCKYVVDAPDLTVTNHAKYMILNALFTL